MSSSLQPFRHAVLGKEVALVWRGHGSAILLELGELTPSNKRRRDGSLARPYGEVSLMIEWSWRIEGPRSILGGSWSSERKWPELFKRLTGGRVTDVSTFGVLPEVLVSLSNGYRVASFMTAEGQPEWALISRRNPKGTLRVSRGKLSIEPPSA